MADRSTIYEVAKRSGVSTATVSRVMTDGRGFSAATRERVLAVATELGWIPSGPARGLALRRSRIVGLLFPDVGQPAQAGGTPDQERAEGSDSEEGHHNQDASAAATGWVH